MIVQVENLEKLPKEVTGPHALELQCFFLTSQLEPPIEYTTSDFPRELVHFWPGSSNLS